MDAEQYKRIAALVVALVVPLEGMRQYAYYDPPGILTACYGHTGNDVKKHYKYSLKECGAFLSADMKAAITTVERCVPGLPDNMTAAYADAVYNIGGKIVCDTKASTLARRLQQHRYIDACKELPKWNKATIAGVLTELPGLTKRRQKEMELCLG